MLQKLAHAITRRPKFVLIIAALLVIPAVIGMAATRINYDILTYLPQNLDSSKGEKLLEDPFHMAATSMLIVQDMPPDYVAQLQKEIEAIPNVSKAISLSGTLGAQFPTEMLPQELQDTFYAENTATGSSSTIIAILFDKPGASDETMEAISQIYKICNEKCLLAGFSVLIRDTKDLVDQELPVYVSLAVVLSLVAMCLTMESWVLPLAIMLNLGMAILLNFGTNIIFGEISYITKAIAAVLQLGVTMDYSVFLYSRYREEQEKCTDKPEAMSRAIQAAFLSLSGSSLTTVAGFAALCFMQLTLGRDIGLVMLKGVILGVTTVIFILPAILLVLDEPIERFRHRVFNLDFSKLTRFQVKHRKAVVILAVLLLIPAAYAQQHTKVFYDLLDTMPADLPSVVATNKLTKDYHMNSTHFILIRDNLTTQETDQMIQDLKAVKGVDTVLSYSSIIPTSIPDFFIPDSIQKYFHQDGWQIIVVNSPYKNATDAADQQVKSINSIVKAYDSHGYVTGEAAMTADLIHTSSHDFKVTNYISMAAVFLIILFVFRSPTIPAVLVAVIELAVFINQGIPYFAGTEIAFIAPTIISCVQLGATVDYSILMTSRFREELQNGLDRKDAIVIASTTSSRSILTSALVMFSATLVVGLVSKIQLISSICIMLARGALISAAVCILILPAILLVCEPLFARTSMNWRTVPVKQTELKEAVK